MALAAGDLTSLKGVWILRENMLRMRRGGEGCECHMAADSEHTLSLCGLVAAQIPEQFQWGWRR